MDGAASAANSRSNSQVSSRAQSPEKVKSALAQHQHTAGSPSTVRTHHLLASSNGQHISAIRTSAASARSDSQSSSEEQLVHNSSNDSFALPHSKGQLHMGRHGSPKHDSGAANSTEVRWQLSPPWTAATSPSNAQAGQAQLQTKAGDLKSRLSSLSQPQQVQQAIEEHAVAHCLETSGSLHQEHSLADHPAAFPGKQLSKVALSSSSDSSLSGHCRDAAASALSQPVMQQGEHSPSHNQTLASTGAWTKPSASPYQDSLDVVSAAKLASASRAGTATQLQPTSADQLPFTEVLQPAAKRSDKALPESLDSTSASQAGTLDKYVPAAAVKPHQAEQDAGFSSADNSPSSKARNIASDVSEKSVTPSLQDFSSQEVATVGSRATDTASRSPSLLTAEVLSPATSMQQPASASEVSGFTARTPKKQMLESTGESAGLNVHQVTDVQMQPASPPLSPAQSPSITDSLQRSAEIDQASTARSSGSEQLSVASQHQSSSRKQVGHGQADIAATDSAEGASSVQSVRSSHSSVGQTRNAHQVRSAGSGGANSDNETAPSPDSAVMPILDLSPEVSYR